MKNLLKSVCDHFHMSNMPFLQRSKTPFESESFNRNMSLISPAFFSRQLVVVTGMSGSGKSSLLFYAINELDPSSFRICHAELSNPNKKALYKILAVKMGIDPAYNADDIKLQIINFFNEENEQGKFNIAIIDEAHTLSIPMVDELRSFYDEGANFSLILSGLPLLLSKTMKLSQNQPMKQRINMVIELDPMSASQTVEYMKHQLDLVKAAEPVFDEKCYPAIHSITFGVPRRINQLCYRAMIDAYVGKKSIITVDDVREVAQNSPHIFDKIVLPEDGTTLVQNRL
jgi:type II secretory pathway predicted ATPase ExeA